MFKSKIIRIKRIWPKIQNLPFSWRLQVIFKIITDKSKIIN